MARASLDLGQVTQGELVRFADQLGAILARNIMRELANSCWSDPQPMTTLHPEGDYGAATALAAGVAPSWDWLWGT